MTRAAGLRRLIACVSVGFAGGRLAACDACGVLVCSGVGDAGAGAGWAGRGVWDGAGVSDGGESAGDHAGGAGEGAVLGDGRAGGGAGAAGWHV